MLVILFCLVKELYLIFLNTAIIGSGEIYNFVGRIDLMSVFKYKQLLFALLSFLGVMFIYSGSVDATTIVQPQEPESVTRSIAGTMPTKSNATTSEPDEVQPDNNTFYHDKNIWVIGDSLAVGWDGQRNVSKNYPTLVGEKLQPKVMQASYASSGSQISGNQNGTPTYDMSNNVQRVINDQQFSDANILIIELGVNDLNYSSNNLGYVQQRLQSNIQRLRKANPNIKIFGVLPLASYQTNKASQYSLSDLQVALTKVYNSFGIPVLNWGNTNVAHGPADLGDHLVHPTQSTYENMANAISEWLLESSNLNVSEHDATTNFISNGWQVNEQGVRQYAENNVLVTGLKNINNKTYYFDPKTKGLVKSQFITVNGHQYYTDSDGSISKNSSKNNTVLQIINGKAYEVNNSGMLTMSTKTGYLKTEQGWRWLEHGVAYTGFRHYMGTYYWFVDGVRQDAGWRKAWNFTYYTDKNGRAVQGKQWIDGQLYDFGNDGTFYLRGKVVNKRTGYINVPGVGWRWLEHGVAYTGFRHYMGTYYWFVDGVRQDAGWRKAWNFTYYTDKNGRAVQGKQWIDGQLYDFGNDGTFYLRGKVVNKRTGYINVPGVGWRWLEADQLYTGFRKYMGAFYYFKGGIRQENQWVSEWGHQYYVGNDGRSVEGQNVNIDGKKYNFGNDHTFYLR